MQIQVLLSIKRLHSTPDQLIMRLSEGRGGGEDGGRGLFDNYRQVRMKKMKFAGGWDIK